MNALQDLFAVCSCPHTKTPDLRCANLRPKYHVVSSGICEFLLADFCLGFSLGKMWPPIDPYTPTSFLGHWKKMTSYIPEKSFLNGGSGRIQLTVSLFKGASFTLQSWFVSRVAWWVCFLSIAVPLSRSWSIAPSLEGTLVEADEDAISISWRAWGANISPSC